MILAQRDDPGGVLVGLDTHERVTPSEEADGIIGLEQRFKRIGTNVAQRAVAQEDGRTLAL